MMKRAAKAWLTAAAVLAVAGVLLFVAVMAAHHWDFSALSTARPASDTVELRESFSSISIASDTESIAFLPAEGGGCRVEFIEFETVRHTAAVKDGTLVIETADEGRWYDHLMVVSFKPSITVYLPQDAYASLSIDQSTGDVSIPKDFTFENVTISASTGDIEIGASVSGPVRVDTDTGDIRIRDASVGALDLSVSTGAVEVGSVNCAGELSITVSTGKAALRGVSCRSLTSRGSTGDITLEDVTAAETISIERSTGDARFAQCDAQELLVTTETGDVTGSLLSEKVFITKSKTGRVAVPETTRGGTCRIATDTGDITISIP